MAMTPRECSELVSTLATHTPEELACFARRCHVQLDGRRKTRREAAYTIVVRLRAMGARADDVATLVADPNSYR